ncbi:unnamed protein product [Mytilus coruscus]|uniref:Integrase core domain-containing protein n=1 Tax=Mytilus coruscus TaxID=42192 RepID=A0A6J8D7V5_MYTCO|nr:unnamed protein product [Mytilus coruscus]
MSDTTGASSREVTDTTGASSRELTDTTGARSREVTDTTGASIREVTDTGASSREVTGTMGASSRKVIDPLGASSREVTDTTGVSSREETDTTGVKRILKKLRLFRRKHYTPLKNVVAFIKDNIKGSGRLHGYCWRFMKCRQGGFTLQKENVRIKIQIINPEGVEMRRKGRLHRREYCSKRPNFIWHLDSYDKLKPFGICINWCIDGFYRLIIWLEAGQTSSDPRVISGYFVKAILQKGGPMVIRGDLGTKNILEVYGTSDYVLSSDIDKIEICLEQSTYCSLPCDENNYDLANLYMEEIELGLPTDAFEAATLYRCLLELFETDLALERDPYRTYVDFDNMVLPILL